MKVVLDSNVLISAFLVSGCAKDVLDLAIERSEIVLSEYILSEVEEKLIHKLKFPKLEVGTIIDFLSRCCSVMEPKESRAISFQDQKDVPILQLARESGAAFLITGDKRLLKLKRIEGTKIISVRDALKFFATPERGVQRKNN